MSNILVPNNGTTAVATETVTRDGTTEHIQLFGMVDTGANDAVGTSASGVTPASGGSGMLGFLSSIYKALTGTLQVAGSINNFPAAQGSFQNSAGTGQYAIVADASSPINCGAAATVTLVSGVAGKSIYVTGADLVSNGSGTIQITYGASNTPVTGAYPVTAEAGVSRGGGVGLIWKIPAGQDLKITTTGSATAQGSISYTQF